MADARYFIPDHASLGDVYSKDDLRDLLQAGELSRSDIVFDDETGLAHLLGDLLITAYREPRAEGARSARELNDDPPREHEFRAHTPLPRPETESESDEDEDEDDGGDADTLVSRDAEPSSLEQTEDDLMEPAGEELLYHGHPSWLAYPKSVLALFGFGGAAWLFYHFHAELAWIIVSDRSRCCRSCLSPSNAKNSHAKKFVVIASIHRAGRCCSDLKSSIAFVRCRTENFGQSSSSQ